MSKSSVVYNKDTRKYKIVGKGFESMHCNSIREARWSYKFLKRLHQAHYTVDKDGALCITLDLKGL